LTQGLCQNADFWQSLCTSDAVADSPGTVAGFVRQGGRKIPCRWQDANGICSIPSIYAYPDGSFYFSYKVSGKTYYYAKPTDGDVTVTTY